MDKSTDGNTGESEFVSIRDGIICISESLEPEYGSTLYECHLYHIASTLKDIAQRYYDEVQLLKAENARLNGRPQRPQLKPSKIAADDVGYRSSKRKRTEIKNPNKSKLCITRTEVLEPVLLPEGARFKGYKNYYVQEMDIKIHYVCYRRQRWQTPDGKEVVGELPESLKGYHFGSTLRQFILYQYFHNHVTQPLLLNQLRELGVSISSGQLSNLLTKKTGQWQQEKENLLQTGLRTSSYIQVDDTGARHQGKNGYCTQFGNNRFAYFKTGDNKSKSNFLSILLGDSPGFKLNQAAYTYLQSKKGFSNWDRNWIKWQLDKSICYSSQNELMNYLDCQRLNKASYKTIIEAATIGYLSEEILPENSLILSDQAKQFEIGRNAACWVHAERKLTQVIPQNARQALLKEKKLNQFWRLYQSLKEEAHHKNLTPRRKYQLKKRFDNLCQPVEQAKSLNAELERLFAMKKTLLQCLVHSEVPLHNNLSESDIREYVKRRKISGCTKSDDGRDAIDTFLSLKKTCQRHGISFWLFLADRLENLNEIPELSEFIVDPP